MEFHAQQHGSIVVARIGERAGDTSTVGKADSSRKAIAAIPRDWARELAKR